MLTENLWRHIDYSWRRPYSRKSTAGFGFSDGTRLAMCTFICILNFDETSQSTAELFLLPVCGNGRPEIYFCMAFCIGVPTFIQYRSTHAVLWRYIDFQDGGEIHLRLRCWWRHSFKNIQISRTATFDEIYQTEAELLLLSFCEKRTSTILKFYFQFRFWPMHRNTTYMAFCMGVPNFIPNRSAHSGATKNQG